MPGFAQIIGELAASAAVAAALVMQARKFLPGTDRKEDTQRKTSD